MPLAKSENLRDPPRPHPAPWPRMVVDAVPIDLIDRERAMSLIIDALGAPEPPWSSHRRIWTISTISGGRRNVGSAPTSGIRGSIAGGGGCAGSRFSTACLSSGRPGGRSAAETGRSCPAAT